MGVGATGRNSAILAPPCRQRCEPARPLRPPVLTVVIAGRLAMGLRRRCGVASPIATRKPEKGDSSLPSTGNTQRPLMAALVHKELLR